MSYQQAAERRLKKKKMISTNQKIMTQITRTKNLKYYLLHVFHYILILKYLFSLFLITICWKHVFLEIMQSHWRFIWSKRLHLTFSNLTSISMNIRTFVKTTNKRRKYKNETWNTIATTKFRNITRQFHFWARKIKCVRSSL